MAHSSLTSSRFDCFALLALYDAALSLALVSVALVRGRGMFEGLSEKALCARLGVPLKVPVVDILADDEEARSPFDRWARCYLECM